MKNINISNTNLAKRLLNSNFIKISKANLSTKDTNTIKENLKNDDIEISNFHKFMDDNIKKDNKNNVKSNIVDDVKILSNILKCPMTDNKLDITNEYMKVEVNITHHNIFSIFIIQ